MAAYLHKKFKKYASSGQRGDDKQDNRTGDREPSEIRSNALKHGVERIVEEVEGDPGAGVLLHRQYYCDVCRIAFRVKSNLQKHLHTRSHTLKVEKDISTPESEMIKELGESGKIELDPPIFPSSDPEKSIEKRNRESKPESFPTPVFPKLEAVDAGMVQPLSHPDPRIQGYPGSSGSRLSHQTTGFPKVESEARRGVYYNSQPNGLIPYPVVPQPKYEVLPNPHEKPTDLKNPHLNFASLRDVPLVYTNQLDGSKGSSTRPVAYSAPAVPREATRGFVPVAGEIPPNYNRPRDVPVEVLGKHPYAVPREVPRNFDSVKDIPAKYHQGESRDFFPLPQEASSGFPAGYGSRDVIVGKAGGVPRPEERKPEAGPTDLSKKLNASSLEKRINAVISQNQAIVETLDPLWKGRYMRQSSREGETDGGKGQRGGSRRYSQSISSGSNESGQESRIPESHGAVHVTSAVNLPSQFSSVPLHQQGTLVASYQPLLSNPPPLHPTPHIGGGYPLPQPAASQSSAAAIPPSHSIGKSQQQPRLALPPHQPLPGRDFGTLQQQQFSQQQQLLQQPIPQQKKVQPQTAVLHLQQPPRPDSNIPLNLSDTSRKRKSPEGLTITGDSVKEVWLNSQKKSGNISHMEDIASRIESGFRSGENPFHPDNPEGSIIKDLLLKTRGGGGGVLSGPVLLKLQEKELLHKEEFSQGKETVQGKEVILSQGNQRLELSRNKHEQDSLDHQPASTMMKPGEPPLKTEGPGQDSGHIDIPTPRNILHRPSATESLYQCNLCQVTFKNLENIEIHQRHYCKNTPGTTETTVLLRPNSTVTHSRTSPNSLGRGSPCGGRTSPSSLTRGSPGVRRRSESSSSSQPSPKRLRRDSVGSSPHLLEGVKGEGLLQIAQPTLSSSLVDPSKSYLANTVSSVSGIPTPNLSGVLTGIKAPPLFSLPGVRTELPKSEEKPVAFVLGMPGPYSQPSTVDLRSIGVSSPPIVAQQLVPTSVTGQLQPLSVGTTLHLTGLNSPNSKRPSFGKPVTKAAELVSTVLAGSGDHIFMKPPSTLASPVAPRERRLSAPSAAKSPKSEKKPGAPEPEVNRPKSLPLGGPTSARKMITLSGASLISPETPRPKKPYVLHYQNGTAYTYLGLKCSTRVFFCSIHKAQPNYVELEKNSKVSMYSNWKVISKDSHPSGLSPQVGMSCYNSSYKENYKGAYTLAQEDKTKMITTHSSTWQERKEKQGKSEEEGTKAVTTVEGGYKSSDDNYTYIRGRGRGKYICDSCGIRCKKPSMLKKHIRTHTNVRPYTCKYCNFSFKTKGNLTKHMKSKAHSKKCVELGIIPVPTSAEESQMDDSKMTSEITLAGDSDSDDGEDIDVDDIEEEDEEDPEEKFDDADKEEVSGGYSQGTSASLYDSKGYEAGSLGLAPRAPRFSTYPFVSTAGQSLSGPQTVKMNRNQQDQERVNRITQLARGVGDNSQVYEIKVEPGIGGQQPGSEASLPSSTTAYRIDLAGNSQANLGNIWRIANMTDAATSRLEYPQQQLSGQTRQQVTIPNKGCDGLAQVSYAVSPAPLGGQPSSSARGQPQTEDNQQINQYIQEYAAFKAQQLVKDYNLKVVKEEKPEEFDSHPRGSQESVYEARRGTDTNPVQVIPGPDPRRLINQGPVSVRFLETDSRRSQSQESRKFHPTDSDPTQSGGEGLRGLDADPSGAPGQWTESSQSAQSPGVTLAEKEGRKEAQEKEKKDYIHNFAQQTDTIPQNVTMNVKDIPSFPPGHSLPPPPEFNVPQITKADSPIRKPADIQKIRIPDSVRSTDSPASNSSTETEEGQVTKPQEIFQVNEEGKSQCGICSKVFSKSSQLRLHVNIHYFERPFRCDSCAVSFRTKGHLQKHKRSVGHFNKVNINATFGAPSTDNPRPFKCADCMIAFRIHGHLAKHLRSKMHIMKLECLGKLPIGMYAEMERLGTNLNEIDTTDCENSLESLQQMAVRLYEKDPSKLTTLEDGIPNLHTGSDISEDEDSNQGLREPKEAATAQPIEVKEEPGIQAPKEDKIRADSGQDTEQRVSARYTPDLDGRLQPRTTPDSDARLQTRTTPDMDGRMQVRIISDTDGRLQSRSTPDGDGRLQLRATPDNDLKLQSRTTPETDGRLQRRYTPEVEARYQSRSTPDPEYRARGTPDSERRSSSLATPPERNNPGDPYLGRVPEGFHRVPPDYSSRLNSDKYLSKEIRGGSRIDGYSSTPEPYTPNFTPEPFQRHRHPGNPVVDRYTGNPTVDRHPSNPTVDRYTGNPAADRHPCNPIADRYPGNPTVDRYHANHTADRHTGKPTADRYDSNPVSDRHAGKPTDNRFAVNPGADRYASHSVADRHTGNLTADRYAANPAADRYAANPAADRHAGNPTTDRYAANPAADRHAGNPAAERYAANPAGDRHPGTPAGDRYHHQYPDSGTTVFTCHICSVKISNPISFQQHLAGHVKPRPYVCRHCDAGFSTLHQLENHAALHQQV